MTRQKNSPLGEKCHQKFAQLLRLVRSIWLFYGCSNVWCLVFNVPHPQAPPDPNKQCAALSRSDCEASLLCTYHTLAAYAPGHQACLFNPSYYTVSFDVKAAKQSYDHCLLNKQFSLQLVMLLFLTLKCQVHVLLRASFGFQLRFIATFTDP